MHLSRTRIILASTATALSLGAATAGIALDGAPASATPSSAAHKAKPRNVVRNGQLSKDEKARTKAAVAVLNTFNTGNTDALYRYIDKKTYINHNPQAQNGRDALAGLIKGIKGQLPDYSLDVRRTITEGNLVVVHALVKTTPQDRGGVEVDIFRFNKQNKIVEHWDAGQQIVEKTASGNPQI